MESHVLKTKIQCLKVQIDALIGNFFTKENQEDFRYELDSACASLDDALDVIDRDAAYRHLNFSCL